MKQRYAEEDTHANSGTHEHERVAVAVALGAADGRGGRLNKRLDLLHTRVDVVDGGRARRHAVYELG